jgi:hypothetical protein
LLGPYYQSVYAGQPPPFWRARSVFALSLTLLFLVPVIFGYARLEELSVLVVFGQDGDCRFFGLWSHKSAELGATVV